MIELTDEELMASTAEPTPAPAPVVPRRFEELFPNAVEVIVKGKKTKIPVMPESCMYGWLGQKARELDVPLGFAYPTVITVFAGNNCPAGDYVRPTLYTALIGPVHCGKSLTMDRAVASFEFQHDGVVAEQTVASDRGLYNLFGVKKKKDDETVTLLKTHVLVQDELRDMLCKVGIQNSSLAPVLCKLFYKDSAGVAVKEGVHDVLVRLSILGGLKCKDAEEFSEVFGKQTNDGLYDRFIFAIAPPVENADWEWKPNKEVRFPKGVRISTATYAAVNEWCADGKKIDRDRGRTKELVLRVALLTASANHEDVVTEECVRCAIKFGEWQEQVREQYKAGQATNLEGQCMEAVLDFFTLNPGKKYKWSDLGKIKSWYRKYSSCLERVRKQLIGDGVLMEDTEDEEDERGKVVKKRRTGMVWLPKKEE